MQINVTEKDIAACHPLNKARVAPILVKFIYHEHRDLAWKRKSWLRGNSNSMNKPIVIEEFLAPTDNNIKKEARERNVKTITKQQEVYAFNPNHA